jgi:hypothetical protein
MYRRDAEGSAITDLEVVEDKDPVRASYRKIGASTCAPLLVRVCINQSCELLL